MPQFNHLTINHPHIVQSPEWGEVKSKIGTPAVRVGDVQFTLHKVPLLPLNVGYCPKVEADKIDWGKLAEAGREHRCIFIKIEPNERVSKRGKWVNVGNLRKSKPVFATQTILLDLTKSEEELLAEMHPKTRYNVRLAQRKGVGVGKRTDPEALEIFLRLQKETAKRQGFFVHTDSYYRTVWEVLHPQGKAYLLIASISRLPFDSVQSRPPAIPLAAWMLLRYKNTLYYPYGGSSEKFRNLMPSSLIMWEAIKLGKKWGCQVFDMWGATDDQSDPWYGFTRFKLGYGGKLITFIGAYDLVLNPPLYWLFILADKLRWFILRLKRLSV